MSNTQIHLLFFSTPSMSESSTSCADGGPPRDLYYPIDSTHIDIGCVACGSCIKQCCKSTPLSELIRRHKKESPLCFDGSTIDDAYAECARAIEERVRSKMSLFDRNRHGDTDSFFTRDQLSGFQCTQCNKCFEKQGQASHHVCVWRSDRMRRLRHNRNILPQDHIRYFVSGAIGLSSSSDC